MLRLFWQNEQGIVLPLAIMVIVVFTLLGFSAVFLVDSQRTFGEQSISQMEALHFAEAGIHAYLAHLNNKPNENWEITEPVPFEDGYYQVEEILDPNRPLFRIVKSTGWAEGDEQNSRTIKASIGRRAFNQFSYFSGTDSFINSKGKREGIVWTSDEKCFGPYHTNDTLYISGTPVFYGPVTYVNGVEGVGNNEAKIFRQGHQQVPAIEVPPDNYELKARALEEGHYYNGRTRILLKGDTYDVKYFSNGQEVFEQGKSLPRNGVIYVDGTSSTNKFANSAGNLFVSGELAGSLTIGAANEIYITGYNPIEDRWYRTIYFLGIPIGYEFNATPTPRSNQQGLIYKNTEFTAVRENGTIVGYKADTSKGNDLLGLVANNNIKILGEGWLDRTSGNVAPHNIHIHGAVFSINSGFEYESFDKYSKGSIVLRGSLIQKERRPVGQVSGAGYTKDYAHDDRMLYATPPNFPEPLSTGWDIKEWIVDPIDT